MSLRQDILSWLDAHLGPPAGESNECDILGSFYLEGDDATDMLSAFSHRFGADLSTLQWEYHFKADEPPPKHRRVLPVGTDGTVIPFQPIRLDDLERAAETGRWVYDYPDYTIRIFWLYRPWVWMALCLLGMGSLVSIIVLAGL